MADKPAPKPTDDAYTDEEADRRTDATIRAMIGMKPKPHAGRTASVKRPRQTKQPTATANGRTPRR